MCFWKRLTGRWILYLGVGSAVSRVRGELWRFATRSSASFRLTRFFWNPVGLCSILMVIYYYCWFGRVYVVVFLLIQLVSHDVLISPSGDWWWYFVLCFVWQGTGMCSTPEIDALCLRRDKLLHIVPGSRLSIYRLWLPFPVLWSFMFKLFIVVLCLKIPDNVARFPSCVAGSVLGWTWHIPASLQWILTRTPVLVLLLLMSNWFNKVVLPRKCFLCSLFKMLMFRCRFKELCR